MAIISDRKLIYERQLAALQKQLKVKDQAIIPQTVMGIMRENLIIIIGC